MKFLFYVYILLNFACSQSDYMYKNFNFLDIVILSNEQECIKCRQTTSLLTENFKNDIVVIFPSIREIEVPIRLKKIFGSSSINFINNQEMFDSLSRLAFNDIGKSGILIMKSGDCLYSSDYSSLDLKKIDSIMQKAEEQ